MTTKITITEVKVKITSILGESEVIYQLRPKATGWDLWIDNKLKTKGAVFAKGATKEEAIQRLLNLSSDFVFSRELISVK